MDDRFGMAPLDAQSDEYDGRYAESVPARVHQAAGRRHNGGAAVQHVRGRASSPERLVIDGGAGRQAA